jgi:hypothetical protein
MNLRSPRQIAKTFSFYYDDNWLGWAPGVVEATLEQKFDESPSETDLERIEATREILRSDRFRFEPQVFENCGRALCGLPLSSEVWEPMQASEMAYALRGMRELVGTAQMTPDSIGPQVKAYMATVLAMGPLPVPTEWFGFHPAAKPLRRLIHVPDVAHTTQKRWENLMETPPDTPRGLYRAIKTEYQPGSGEETPETASYRHLIRLASIWHFLYKRDAAPQENPFAGSQNEEVPAGT